MPNAPDHFTILLLLYKMRYSPFQFQEPGQVIVDSHQGKLKAVIRYSAIFIDPIWPKRFYDGMEAPILVCRGLTQVKIGSTDLKVDPKQSIQIALNEKPKQLINASKNWSSIDETYLNSTTQIL